MDLVSTKFTFIVAKVRHTIVKYLFKMFLLQNERHAYKYTHFSFSWYAANQTIKRTWILLSRVKQSKKSRRSDASSEDVYKSQWVHFAVLDSFLRAQVTPRASQSNMVSICIRNLSHVPLPWYLALTVKIVTKFISYSSGIEEARFPPCWITARKGSALACLHCPGSTVCVSVDSSSNVPEGVYFALDKVFVRRKLWRAQQAKPISVPFLVPYQLCF